MCKGEALSIVWEIFIYNDYGKTLLRYKRYTVKLLIFIQFIDNNTIRLI
jgi:hypothetical protein